MWDCECGLRFKDPDIGITCPMCGSMNIVEIGDIIPDWDSVEGVGKANNQIAKMKNDLDKINDALDSFGITEQDYEEAGLDGFTQNFDLQNAVESTPLSFNDMEINEMCLLDLETNDRDCVEITFFTDMNSRFLRTFLGEPVWA